MIRIAVAAILGLLLLSVGTLAFADSGVGITPGKIDVHDELKPGGRYNLPSVTVINTGDQKQQYEVLVSFLADQQVRRPSEKWLRIEPQRFELEGGESQLVEFSLALPGSAEPGEYFALLEAQTVALSSQSFQPSVATKLTFFVGPSGWLETLRRQINNYLDDAAPWIYVLPIAALGAGVLRWSSRRVRFRLPFEPR